MCSRITSCMHGRYGLGRTPFLIVLPWLCFKQPKCGSYFKEYIELHDAASVTRAITLMNISGRKVHGAYAPMEPLHPPPSLASLIACRTPAASGINGQRAC